MEITTASNSPPEKVPAVQVYWTLLNEPSPKALRNFNRILATAQLRVYRESMKKK